ncbi:DUF305 domain-containing protein [Nocardia sp. NBC_00511]|uniref:DUF305 domain-containing protein n=1 Tax=Nocardia sp. NBC_00511 TaxID=2903591 RepID=UPI0030DF24E0
MRSFPTRRHRITTLAFGSLALLLLVLGAAARPLVAPEKPAPPPVLNAIEIGFTQDMLAHHQQALIMAQRLDPAADPTVRGLAQQIADNQRVEVGMMLGWLRLTGVTPTDPHPMAWMHAAGDTPASGHHGHPTLTSTAPVLGTTMPGTASPAELDALSAAHGRDAEVLFLQLMRRHHYGGIAMAQAADSLLASGPVKLAARDMISAQSQEIGVMGMLLTQRENLG